MLSKEDYYKIKQLKNALKSRRLSIGLTREHEGSIDRRDLQNKMAKGSQEYWRLQPKLRHSRKIIHVFLKIPMYQLDSPDLHLPAFYVSYYL